MTQIIMCKLASSIMRHLWFRGSNVSLFSVQPVDGACVTHPRHDENGHSWPEYFYSRGRTLDATGFESPTAVPVTEYSLGLADEFNVMEPSFAWSY